MATNWNKLSKVLKLPKKLKNKNKIWIINKYKIIKLKKMTKTHIKITGTYYVANVKKKTENIKIKILITLYK